MSTVESSIYTVYIDIINAGVTATATGGSTVALLQPVRACCAAFIHVKYP